MRSPGLSLGDQSRTARARPASWKSGTSRSRWVIRSRYQSLASGPGMPSTAPMSAQLAPVSLVLVSESRDADLLVVGHRGRGAFHSTMLGSVGLQCVLHASVPVTVVRAAPHPVAPDDDRDTARARA
jgi:hypothetical protein